MFIIGAGRVGTSLQRRSAEYDIDVELVTRTEGWDALEFGVPGDPIVVATRNDDLLEVIERVPEWLRQDLVFIQNGQLRRLLQNNGLVNATRGLIYFAARSRPGEIEPGGVNWFCGPHALTMTRWLSIMKLRARAVDWARFSYYELEKLAWLCIFGPLCEKHDCTVGEVCSDHTEELKAVVAEFHAYGRMAFNVQPKLSYLYDRLVAYSESIPTFRAGVKEWQWRNGAVLEAVLDHQVTMPRHVQLLVEAGHRDKIPPELAR